MFQIENDPTCISGCGTT